MAIKPILLKGQTFVEGRSEENAQRLIGLAEKAGLVSEVFTTSHGYIVPTSILPDATEEPTPEAPAPAAESTEAEPPKRRKATRAPAETSEGAK